MFDKNSLKQFVWNKVYKNKKMTYVYTIYNTKMWEIFKHKKGKDFYRDNIAFFSYNLDDYDKYQDDEYEYIDDDVISFYVAKKIYAMNKNY